MAQRRTTHSTPKPTTFLDALVLRLVSIGEADLVVSTYTREIGRLDALAKGARKSLRRYGGHLALLGRVRLEVRGDPHEAAHGRLVPLASVELLRATTGLETDLTRLALASYAAEIVLVAGQPGHADARLFDLCDRAIVACAACTPGDEVALRLALEVALLGELGAWPDVDRCVRCGLPNGHGATFEAPFEGMTCAVCAGRPGPFRAEDVAALGAMGSGSAPLSPPLTLPPSARRATERAVRVRFDRTIGTRIRSREVLDGILGN